MAGWRGVRGVWPALLVCGGSFAVVQFLISNYVGPMLVDVVGGVASLVCLALFLRVWRPRDIWRFADEAPAAALPGPSPRSPASTPRGFEGSSTAISPAWRTPTRWELVR